MLSTNLSLRKRDQEAEDQWETDIQAELGKLWE